MPTYGPTASSTSPSIDLDFKHEVDWSKFTRLANLLFAPSTETAHPIVAVTS